MEKNGSWSGTWHWSCFILRTTKMAFHPVHNTTATTPTSQDSAEFSIWWVSQIHVGGEHPSLLSWCKYLVCCFFLQCCIGTVDLRGQIRFLVYVQREVPSGFLMSGLTNMVKDSGSYPRAGLRKATSTVEMISGSRPAIAHRCQSSPCLPNDTGVFANQGEPVQNPQEIQSLSYPFVILVNFALGPLKKKHESSLMLPHTQLDAKLQLLSNTRIRCLHNKDVWASSSQPSDHSFALIFLVQIVFLVHDGDPNVQFVEINFLVRRRR